MTAGHIASNMHGWHPQAAKRLCIIYSKLLGLLLGNHARAGSRPSKWTTETALAVAVDHCNGVLLMKYVFIMVRTNIVVNGRL